MTRPPRFIVRRSARNLYEDLAASVNSIKFKEQARQLLKLGVQVGFPVGSTHQPDGTSLATIAAANNYGTEDGHVPERPFMVPAIRKGKPLFKRLNARNLARVMKGELGPYDAAAQLGEAAKGEVQKYIRHGDFTPNAPSTIAAKGSSHPLIDQGQMVQGVTYEVTHDGEAVASK